MFSQIFIKIWDSKTPQVSFQKIFFKNLCFFPPMKNYIESIFCMADFRLRSGATDIKNKDTSIDRHWSATNRRFHEILMTQWPLISFNYWLTSMCGTKETVVNKTEKGALPSWNLRSNSNSLLPLHGMES